MLMTEGKKGNRENRKKKNPPMRRGSGGRAIFSCLIWREKHTQRHLKISWILIGSKIRLLQDFINTRVARKKLR